MRVLFLCVVLALTVGSSRSNPLADQPFLVTIDAYSERYQECGRNRRPGIGQPEWDLGRALAAIARSDPSCPDTHTVH